MFHLHLADLLQGHGEATKAMLTGSVEKWSRSGHTQISGVELRRSTTIPFERWVGETIGCVYRLEGSKNLQQSVLSQEVLFRSMLPMASQDANFAACSE